MVIECAWIESSTSVPPKECIMWPQKSCLHDMFSTSNKLSRRLWMCFMIFVHAWKRLSWKKLRDPTGSSTDVPAKISNMTWNSFWLFFVSCPVGQILSRGFLSEPFGFFVATTFMLDVFLLISWFFHDQEVTRDQCCSSFLPVSLEATYFVPNHCTISKLKQV